MDMIPKVVQAVAGENFSVYAYFSDGTVRLLDASPLVRMGGVFARLQDTDFFRDRLTVIFYLLHHASSLFCDAISEYQQQPLSKPRNAGQSRHSNPLFPNKKQKQPT